MWMCLSLFFPEIKFILSFICRLAFSLRSSHFGSLSLVLISVLFGFCCSFLSGLCHLSTSPLLSLLFSLSQFLCLYFCENLSTIHSMFLNPFPTLLLFLIASKVDFHCAPGLLGLGFSSSSSHVSPFSYHHVAFWAWPCLPSSLFFLSASWRLCFLEYLKSDTPIQVHIAYGCFWAMATVHIVVTETVWPTKPKIFTVWHFAKKFCRSLAWRDSWIPTPAPSWMAGECLQLLLQFLVPTAFSLNLLLLCGGGDLLSPLPDFLIPCISDLGRSTSSRPHCKRCHSCLSLLFLKLSLDRGTSMVPPPTSCPFVFWLLSPCHLPYFPGFFCSSDKELCLEVKPGQVFLVLPPSVFN